MMPTTVELEMKLLLIDGNSQKQVFGGFLFLFFSVLQL